MKKFLDYVHAGAVEKLGKALEKGLDPNYHDTESGGETVKAQESPCYFSKYTACRKLTLVFSSFVNIT